LPPTTSTSTRCLWAKPPCSRQQHHCRQPRRRRALLRDVAVTAGGRFGSAASLSAPLLADPPLPPPRPLPRQASPSSQSVAAADSPRACVACARAPLSLRTKCRRLPVVAVAACVLRAL
jgi:hypothetical protein